MSFIAVLIAALVAPNFARESPLAGLMLLGALALGALPYWAYMGPVADIERKIAALQNKFDANVRKIRDSEV